MTSYLQTLLLSEIDSDDPISAETLEYFQARLESRLHSLLLEKFVEAGEDQGMTKAKIARRLSRDPGQVTRLLSGPGNLQLKTISDILLALHCELDCTATTILEKPRRNYDGILGIDPSVPVKESDLMSPNVSFTPDSTAYHIDA